MTGPRAAGLLVIFAALVVVLTAVAMWSQSREPVSTLGVQRLPPPIEASSNATINAAVERSGWTEYADYGTIRIGRVERQARLFTGRRHWVRRLAVPPNGARYEAVIGAIGAQVTVRLGLAGTARFERHAAVDEWTPVSIDLDPRAGTPQSVTIEIEAGGGGIAAWGSEIVLPLRDERRPPDVILISLDTVRRDQLTPYVPSLATTPNLAAFSGEAIRFDQAISTSSWTIGSHATLFTGQFPPDSLGYQSRVEPAELTLPEIFAARGYRTFGVSGGPYTDPRWGLHQGFDEYVVSSDRENARDATSRAIEWLAKADGSPVFLFLNYFNAHEPLDLSPDVQRLTGVTESVPASLWHELDSGLRPVTADVRQRLLRAYGAELTAIDGELERLFADLKRSGRWARTVVIVWGDHGQLLGERGHVGHAYTLEDELVRVPLIVKPPVGHQIPPGVYPHLFQDDDLFALAQALAGISNVKGSEIVTALGANQPVRRLAFSKIHHDPLPTLTIQRRWRSATQWAVRDAQTKIVRDLEGRFFAYDITGPEERPLPKPQPDASLVVALNRFHSWMERMPYARTISPLSPAEIERLRALGYIR